MSKCMPSTLSTKSKSTSALSNGEDLTILSRVHKIRESLCDETLAYDLVA